MRGSGSSFSAVQSRDLSESRNPFEKRESGGSCFRGGEQWYISKIPQRGGLLDRVGDSGDGGQ